VHLVFPGAVLQAVEWRACLDAINAINPVPQMLVISGSHQHARQSIGGF
jgi:hypothetical protein